jgi:predicted PurR-regulated permease PerM
MDMNKKLWIAAGIVAALFFIFNFDHAVHIGATIGNALYPVFIGLLFALILNAPVRLLENTLLSSPKLKKIRRIGALLITLIVVGGILTMAGFLLVPEVIDSINVIAGKLPDLEENGWSSFFGAKLPPFITDNLDKLMAQLTNGLESFLPQALDFFKNTLKTITNILLGLFMGFLILLSKEKLVEGLRKTLLYISDEEKTQKTIASLAMATDKFSRFLAGQLFEAFIFGMMCLLAFLIFKIPYAPLAAVIMAFANLIPMVGGYIGGAVAFLFIFSANPAKALVFVAVILVVQQIEQVTTYPVVVGRYVGLSSFWILFSVVVGGGLFGFWGLVLGVPVVAFFHQFFKVMYGMKVKKDLRN